MTSPPPFPSRNCSASALLLVLGMIVLVSAVVLAFFSAATTERTAAHSQANSEAVRNLSNNALQFAMAQITDATKGGTAQAPLAWASQPGMIRTYDSSGNPHRYYKLYSAQNMTVSNPAGFSLGEDAPPADWRSSPAVWTDLNAPVAGVDGTLNYPILDPAALTGTTAVQPSGFSITNAPGYAPGNPAAADNNPAPMPVRWLYQLKDGTMVPGTGSGNTATVAGATAANPIVGRIAFWADDETSKVNINTAAEGTYWDTPRLQPGSQVNLGAVMQGNPRLPVQSEAWKFPDVAFASYQPARFEFQRYPGHPAQVALSSVFPSVTSQTATSLTPRLVWQGTTEASTVWAGSSTVDLSLAPRKAPYATLDEYQFSETGTSPRTVNSAGSSLSKADLEAAKFFTTANSRAPEVNLFNLPRVAIWPVDEDLATNPASPRTTAFDRLIAFCSTLRKDLGSNAHRYFFQRSDAQSPTHDYSNIPRNQDLYSYLQRLTGDPVPGFGGDFESKYDADRDQILTEIFDYIRCTNLVDPNLGNYPLTAPAVGGGTWPRLTNQFVKAIKTPYNGNGNALLGLGQVMPIRIGDTVGFGRFAALKEIAFAYVCVGDGALPDTTSCTDAASVDSYLADVGKPTALEIRKMVSNIPKPYPNTGIPEVAPSFPIVSAYLAANPVEWNRIRDKWIAEIGSFLDLNPRYDDFNPALDETALSPIETRVQMMVVFRLYNPAAGMAQLHPDLLIRITGLDAVTVANAQNIGGGGQLFTLPPNCTDWAYKTKEAWCRVYSNPVEFNVLIGDSGRGFRPPWYSTALSGNRPNYPFVSHAFTVNKSEAIQFGGADLTFELHQGKNVHDPKNTDMAATYKDAGAPPLDTVLGQPENLHQTARITFPPENVPLPTLGYLPPSPDNKTKPDPRADAFKIETRLTPDNNGSHVLLGSDQIRSRCFNGDGRLAALMTSIPESMFVAYPGNGQQLGQGPGQVSYRIGGTGSPTTNSGMIPPGTAVTTGDFDIACRMGPGGFINKPDEGDNSRGTGGFPPYFFYDQSSSNSLLYTPNRIMPSPGMFGSLPTGAKAGVGWQTLLFRPQPSHPSHSTTIPDHLIMDLFWMPIVEPYAISESFSTAGKVNMNYQILPFTYINRPTALMAAMKVEMGTAVPSGTGVSPHAAPGIGDPVTGGTTWRKNLNLSETDGSLRQFREKFADGEIFRSASEICDIYLVPRDQSWERDSDAQTFWSNHLNTPENLREKPYTNLYARLTTKSNTFTVHVRAQALQKVPGTPADQWVENRDKVVGEERVSTIVERYIDAEDETLLDFATDANALLSDYYRMRVLSTKRFAP
jgi:hypothetical protein